MADRFGRRRVFQIGIAWFALASLVCAAAPTVSALIAARALQGIGGVFTPGDRGRAIGTWSGLGGIAAAIGPLLGGWLIGVPSWRANFPKALRGADHPCL